jgi:hypothetical protein
MIMWTPRHVRVCVTGLGIALIAGCSSASPSTSTAGSPSSLAASPPAASPPATAASPSQLSRTVLQAVDLPAGWKSKPYTADPRQAASQAALTKCVGTRNTDSDKVAEAHSPGFAYGAASVSSSAASYRSQSALDSDIAMLKSPKLASCYEQTLKKQLVTALPSGATIESASFKITPGAVGDPANVVATGTGAVKVTVKGQRVAVYASIAYITGPLMEVEVDTTNIGEPVTASLVRSMVARVAARAAKG